MAAPNEIARRYFEALDNHDLAAAVDLWVAGGVDRFVGQQDLTAPHDVRRYFAVLFDAFPDFAFEILDEVADGEQVAVRWRARGTFAGPGAFQGFEPNGARMVIEGCDVLTVADDLIQHNEAYVDSGAIARQLGFLPEIGSAGERRLTRLANLGTRARQLRYGAAPERIAEGVWVLRGGRPRTMNVYLVAHAGGVVVFDAGIEEMAGAILAAAARLGGIERVVLGHADADHRGAAPALEAPVYCHPAEREAAESASSFRPYWHLDRLAAPVAKIYPFLLRSWDGGPVQIAGTLSEDDEVAGFRVVELPGHAPGLIGLFRESDRLALVSDCFYTLNPQTTLKTDADVPHPAFNQSTEQARESIGKLAALRPSRAWAGHADPVRGDVRAALERVAHGAA